MVFDHKQFGKFLLTFTVLLCVGNSYALEEVRNNNLTMDEAFMARSAGLSEAYLALPGEELTSLLHPASLANTQFYTFEMNHLEQYGIANWDYFQAILPFSSTSTLGFGLGRYSPGEQQGYISRDQKGNTFEVVDYLGQFAFQRSWKKLDLGGLISFLYRNMDQQGLGLRADVSAQYRFHPRWQVSGLLKGLVPSSTSWESDKVQYEPSDIYLGIGTFIPSTYFYGSFHLGYQTPGLFQKTGLSEYSLYGERLIDDPLNGLSFGKLAFEYVSQFGLSLRAGFTELHAFPIQPSLGAGYRYHHWFSFDYALVPHSDLGNSHRVSLAVFSGFKMFNKSRPGTKIQKPGIMKPSIQPKESENSDLKIEDDQEEEILVP